LSALREIAECAAEEYFVVPLVFAAEVEPEAELSAGVSELCGSVVVSGTEAVPAVVDVGEVISGTSIASLFEQPTSTSAAIIIVTEIAIIIFLFKLYHQKSYLFCSCP